MGDDNMNIKDCFAQERERLHQEMAVLNEKNAQLSKENVVLKDKVKFLEGQVDAYQYALNCKRY
jgi:cell division protein FtsB